MIEHHDAAHQQGGGIGQALAGDVRGGAVDGLEHGAFVADVAAGHYARPPTRPAARSLITSPYRLGNSSISNCCGFRTICMQALSTISSLYSMVLYFSATARTDFRNRPSLSFMMLALWMA